MAPDRARAKGRTLHLLGNLPLRRQRPVGEQEPVNRSDLPAPHHHLDLVVREPRLVQPGGERRLDLRVVSRGRASILERCRYALPEAPLRQGLPGALGPENRLLLGKD